MLVFPNLPWVAANLPREVAVEVGEVWWVVELGVWAAFVFVLEVWVELGVWAAFVFVLEVWVELGVWAVLQFLER